MQDTNKDWLLLLVTCVLMWHPKHHICFTRQSSLSLSTFNHHFLQVRFEILLVSPQARGLKEGRTEVRHQSLFFYRWGGGLCNILITPPPFICSWLTVNFLQSLLCPLLVMSVARTFTWKATKTIIVGKK